MPPKRMSTILASSPDTHPSTTPPTPTPTNTTTTTSEGPTLPLLSAPPSATKKRKRPTPPAEKNADAHMDGTVHETTHTERKRERETRQHTNHNALYAPWTLLPTKQRSAVLARTQDLQVLVWSGNQNVRAGIRRLGGLLGERGRTEEVRTEEQRTEEQRTGEVQTESQRDIVISAQGAGTIKLVSIFELVRRLVTQQRHGSGAGVDAEQDGEKKGDKWWTYTILTSVSVPKRRLPHHVNGEADVPLNAETKTKTEQTNRSPGAERSGEDTNPHETNPAEKSLPVLMVWITRARIPGWAAVFAEREMVVCDGLGEGA